MIKGIGIAAGVGSRFITAPILLLGPPGIAAFAVLTAVTVVGGSVGYFANKKSQEKKKKAEVEIRFDQGNDDEYVK